MLQGVDSHKITREHCLKVSESPDSDKGQNENQTSYVMTRLCCLPPVCMKTSLVPKREALVYMMHMIC